MSDKVQRRNAAILEAGVALAQSIGWRKFNRNDVAAKAGVAAGSVNNAFGTMDGLHDAIMEQAVARSIATVVAAGLAEKHPTALAVPQSLRAAALGTLAAAA